VERFRYLWPSALETVCYQGGALINLRNQPSNYLKLPAFVVAEWFMLLRKLASRKYDLLHSHWILPQGFTGVLSAGILNVPHVTTIHGSDLFALQGGLLKWFKRFTLHQADAVTVNSSVTEHAAREVADRITCLRRIPMGVSKADTVASSAITEIRQRFRSDAGPLLVFVGRVVEEKGVEDLIRSVELLKSRLSGVSALVVGEGQDRIKFEALAEKLRISERVNFTGWVNNDRIPTYLAAADIFVGPSKFESQGLTFIEAMMARVPVIAARTGGIVDSVIHEKTGLLVDIGAPEQIASAVLRMVNEPELLTPMIEQAYHRAMDLFSRESTAQHFSDLYNQLLEGK
jgi:glycosyltransferase involved in cell wall biosynthesis